MRIPFPPGQVMHLARSVISHIVRCFASNNTPFRTAHTVLQDQTASCHHQETTQWRFKGTADVRLREVTTHEPPQLHTIPCAGKNCRASFRGNKYRNHQVLQQQPHTTLHYVIRHCSRNMHQNIALNSVNQLIVVMVKCVLFEVRT
jgi:hypothetical protein